jgi:hypothetical protein
MNTKTSLLLASALALGFTLTTAANAAEQALSPRARDNLIKRVPGTNTDPNLVSGSYLGAAAKPILDRVKVVPTTGTDPNLISGNYAGAALKNPYATPAPFEIAPLVTKSKEKGNACDADCAKACCVKK